MRLARLNNNPEVFYSLQGEGASIGVPSIFVRLFGCNLSCTWCDTAYAWNRETGSVEIERDELLALVRRFPCNRLVITGGEPLVQQKELAGFLAHAGGYRVEMETNGTIIPDAVLDSHIEQYNISPKLHHSGNDSERALRLEVISHFANYLRGKSWFKFVIDTSDDLPSIETIIETCGIDRDRVILMPQAATKHELDEKRLLIANLAIEKGFRFSDRLHITLWGDKKGV